MTARDDMLDFMNTHVPERRPPFGDERRCNHCAHFDECWSVLESGLALGTRFGLRPGWDEDRFKNHMFGIIGQVCGTFEHSNPRMRPHYERADRRRNEILGIQNEWDEEDN